MEEVENTIGDGDDSTVGKKQREKGIEKGKGGAGGLWWWEKGGRVVGEEIVEKVREGRREKKG